MSVQAGIWNFDGRPIDRKLIADISDSLKHQGPDGESCHVDGSIALLYRPFHTTADSRREKQPYFSRRGFILTWDGRLDNRDELIPELRNDLEANPTDVAIIAAAFDRWETDCFRRIVGDWAVSIWKAQQRELVLAIDYMAVRHLFYYLRLDRVWWSTELSALVLLSGDKFHIDDDYIAGYFANDPDAHLTPYREIRKVPPGQFVSIRNGGASIERYRRFTSNSPIRYKTDAEYEEHFRHVFRRAVRRRLRSDSPVLAELSGGLDSSSIVCIADDILANESALTPHLDTLSYYDQTEPSGDDWIYFQKVEEKRGRVGVHIDMSEQTKLVSLEYPRFFPVPAYLGIGRQTDAERAAVIDTGGFRAVLSGIGGDEITGGSPDPRDQLADLVVRFKFVELARQLTAWSLVKRKPWIRLLLQSSMVFLPPSISQHVTKEAKVEPWIDEAFARRTQLPVRQLGMMEAIPTSMPHRRSQLVCQVALSKQMANSIQCGLAPEEARYPYLDQDFLDFVFALPADQLLRPHERRSLMRRSLRNILPEEISSRRTKGTAARTPVVALENNWEQLQRSFESPLICMMGYAIKSRLLETLRAVKNGQTLHLLRLLRAISLEFWLRNLISRGLLHGTATTASDSIATRRTQSAAVASQWHSPPF